MSVSFDPAFVLRDQEVTDLATPRPATRFCLLELPKEELEPLQKGETFRLQQHSDGGAALCSATKTYSVEFSENSNSQFLGFVSPCDAKDNVENAEPAPTVGAEAQPAAKTPELQCKLFAQVRGLLVLKLTNPDYAQLREVVSRNIMQIDLEVKKATSGALVTTAALENDVAASRAEIRTTLQEGPYVEHGGQWKLLTGDYENEVIDVALTAVTARGWDRSAVDVAALLEAVQNHFGETGAAAVPTLEILKKAMRSVIASPPSAAVGEVAAKAPEAGGAAEGAEAPKEKELAAKQLDAIALDDAKVRAFHARHLLASKPAQVRGRFELAAPPPRSKRARVGTVAPFAALGKDQPLQLSELAAAYRELTGAEAENEKLEEEVAKLLGEDARLDELEGTVHPLNPEALPMEARARLKRLFELQSHWRPDALQKLILPVLTGVKPEVWLMKNARPVYVILEPSKGEERFYTRKFAGV